jgi:hypothetical protein
MFQFSVSLPLKPMPASEWATRKFLASVSFFLLIFGFFSLYFSRQYYWRGVYYEFNFTKG